VESAIGDRGHYFYFKNNLIDKPCMEVYSEKEPASITSITLPHQRIKI
jgi:hypothetical protein